MLADGFPLDSSFLPPIHAVADLHGRKSSVLDSEIQKDPFDRVHGRRLLQTATPGATPPVPMTCISGASPMVYNVISSKKTVTTGLLAGVVRNLTSTYQISVNMSIANTSGLWSEVIRMNIPSVDGTDGADYSHRTFWMALNGGGPYIAIGAANVQFGNPFATMGANYLLTYAVDQTTVTTYVNGVLTQTGTAGTVASRPFQPVVNVWTASSVSGNTPTSGAIINQLNVYTCQCTLGYYGTASTSCTICPLNSYCPLGSTSYIPCATGLFCAAGSSDVSQCQMAFVSVNISINGASSSMSQSQFQNALPSNVVVQSYQDAIVVSQSTCPQGYYCPYGSTTPTPCPAGTYNNLGNTVDNSTCIGCPVGSYCPLASILPTQCSAGSYMINVNATKQSDCTVCPTGNYCPAGSVTPTNCSAGTYEPTTNGTSPSSCLACPVGQYCPLATTTPTSCTAGSYRGSTGATQQGDCTTCPSGNYCPIQSVNPINCSAGTYEPSAGGTSAANCLACPVGQYCPLATTTPTSCSAGSYRGSTGATQQGDCTTCPTGNYCPIQSVNPTNCTPGTYEPSTGGISPSSCLACPVGDFCPLATTTPTSCAAGSYRGSTGATQQGDCTTCPSGNYCPIQSVNPTNCTPGTYNPSTGGTSPSNCLSCPVGQYCPLATTTPTSCAAGSYRGSTGATQQGDCTTCPTGNYCPIQSVNPTNCTPGTYEPSTGGTSLSSCLSCPVGLYCPLATTTPTACSAGSYRGSTGATQQGDCTTCPSGNYCPVQSVNPTNCTAGTYNPSTGQPSSASCVSCPPGDYCPTATTTPSLCAANNFSLAGAPVCSVCPAYSTSPPASANCTCGAGHTQTVTTSGGNTASQSYTVVGVASYNQVVLMNPAYWAAPNVPLLTINGWANITVVQGTLLTLTSTPYGGSPINMLISSQLPTTSEDTMPIPRNSLDAAYHGQQVSDYVWVTTPNSQPAAYTTGITGSNTATLVWDTTNAAPGQYFLWTPHGVSIYGFQLFTSIFISSPTPITLTYSLYGNHGLGAVASAGDTVVLSTSGSGNLYIWCGPISDYAGTSYALLTSGAQPFSWNTGSVNFSTTFCNIADVTGATTAGSIFVYPRQAAVSNSPAVSTLSCPNCSAGTRSSAGDASCTSCGYGFYSPAVSSNCTICPTGTMCNSSTTPSPIPCGAGSYQPSTGASFCSTCPVGQYCDSQTTAVPTNCAAGTYNPSPGGPSNTSCIVCATGTYSLTIGSSTNCPTCAANSYCTNPTTIAPCPTHTASVSGSSSLLQCQCVPGYSCAYTKRITAVVTLNTSLTNFNGNVGGVQTSFLAAVASAAGVTPSQVVINNVASSGGSRRLLGYSTPMIDVRATVHGAERLRNLAGHLARHDARLHQGHSWEENHSVQPTRLALRRPGKK